MGKITASEYAEFLAWKDSTKPKQKTTRKRKAKVKEDKIKDNETIPDTFRRNQKILTKNGTPGILKPTFRSKKSRNKRYKIFFPRTGILSDGKYTKEELIAHGVKLCQ